MCLQADMSGHGEPRGKRRFACVFAAALVAAMLVLGACGDDDDDSGGGGGSADQNQVTKVRAAFTPGFASLPVEIAQKKGYFKANGLDVEATQGLDLAAWASALDRQFDIVLSTPPILLGAASQGAPLTVVSGLQIEDEQHQTNVLVVKDPAIKSAADLGGKTVGVPTLTGVNAETTRYLVLEAGIDLDDVKFVAVPFDLQGDQLEAGRIDAAVSTPPFATAMEASGFHVRESVVLRAFEVATDGAQHRATVAFFMSSRSYAEDNPEVVEAWRKSLQQGIDFMAANEAEARDILQAWLKLPPEVAQNAPLPGVDVEITVADLEPYVKIGETVGSLKTAPDVNELFAQGS